MFLCEDDENLGMLLREYLQAKGFKTDYILMEKQVSEVLQRQSDDLCIVDVMMPKKDGITLVKEIRLLTQRYR